VTIERTNDRHGPDVPAWAGTPTSPWSKVPAQRQPADGENGSEQHRGQAAPPAGPMPPGPFPPRQATPSGGPQQQFGPNGHPLPPTGYAGPGHPGQPGYPGQPGQQGHPGQPGHPQQGAVYGQPHPGQQNQGQQNPGQQHPGQPYSGQPGPYPPGGPAPGYGQPHPGAQHPGQQYPAPQQPSHPQQGHPQQAQPQQGQVYGQPGPQQHPGQQPHQGQPYPQQQTGHFPGQPHPQQGQVYGQPQPGAFSPSPPGQYPAVGQQPGMPPGQPGIPQGQPQSRPSAHGTASASVPIASAPPAVPSAPPAVASAPPVSPAGPSGRRSRHAADITGEHPALPVSASPAPAAPVSAAPVSAPAAAPPVEAEAPASATPVSAAPTSAAPVSPAAVATPDTVLPVSASASGAAPALSAPTMLHPLVRPRTLADVTSAEAQATPAAPEAADAATKPAEEQPEAAEEQPEEKVPDPEQELAAIEWRFHHDTLRELVDDPDLLRDLRDRLTTKLTPATDNPTRARLLSLRAVVSRILGDLSKAMSDAKMALMHAEATGELRRIAIAQARLAHVLQWRGDFADADQLFAEANSTELPDRLRATMHEHAGKSCYDQGRYIEACNHFEKALELRKVEDPELMARTELALDAVFRKVAENGWGPYPRTRDEILRVHKPPVPQFDDKKQCWGYVDPSGTTGISPAFADVQPFRDGVAWVRRPESETWELIDEGGQRMIDASAGWLGVGSFSEGLAWVSRDGHSGWVAIDKKNRVVIPNGFDDVRPFRRGVAAVRRGGWGAVDKTGKVVVPTQFAAFATALTDGRYVDGFTDEGLAIVDNGGRKGVVDKTGKVVVPPVHPALVIHPVAFLVASPKGTWGALDRQGRPLIDMELASRTAVIEEIDRLLADTKPVL